MRKNKLFKGISAVILASAMLCSTCAAEAVTEVEETGKAVVMEDLDEAPIKDSSFAGEASEHTFDVPELEEASTEGDTSYLDYGQGDPITDEDADEDRATFGTDTSYAVTSGESQLYPYTAICHVVVVFPSGNEYFTTGAMISANRCLTSAEFLYDPNEGGWASEIYVIPGDYNYLQPYGYTTGYSCTIPTAMKNAIDAGQFDLSVAYYDYGIIKLNDNIGDYSGYLGLMGIDGSDLDSAYLMSIGYDDRSARQVATEGSVYTSYGEGYYRTQMDLSDVMIGAPLIGFDDDNNAYVVGIFVGSSSEYNYYAQFTTDDYNWIQSNM